MLLKMLGPPSSGAGVWAYATPGNMSATHVKSNVLAILPIIRRNVVIPEVGSIVRCRGPRPPLRAYGRKRTSRPSSRAMMIR
jgi:hypothetical protein